MEAREGAVLALNGAQRNRSLDVLLTALQLKGELRLAPRFLEDLQALRGGQQALPVDRLNHIPRLDPQLLGKRRRLKRLDDQSLKGAIGRIELRTELDRQRV